MRRIVIFFMLFCINSAMALSAGNDDEFCNIDAAYAAGIHDVRMRVPSRPHYAQQCHVNLSFKDALSRAYQSGYAAGRSNDVEHRRECVRTQFGEVCGYGCKRNTYGDVKCATYAGQNCQLSPYSQKIICGYDCRKSNTGMVKCGKNYSENCVKNKFGQVTCGRNCRMTIAGVKCDNVSHYTAQDW